LLYCRSGDEPGEASPLKGLSNKATKVD